MSVPSELPAIPQTLYHYTSQEGLLGIMRGKMLWVSSIRHLNDAAELSYAIAILKKYLAGPEIGPEDQLSDTWILFQQGVTKYLGVLENSDSYVGSFSEERDQLSQWRAYTGGGVGFSIGFDFEMLKNAATTRKFELLRCTYAVKEHDEYVRSLIEKSKRALREEGMRGVDKAVIQCVSEFMTFAPRLKHPTFKEEQEWRVFKTTDLGEPVKFRAGKSMLVPYGEFPFRDEHNNTPIVEVVVGPNPHMALSKSSVEGLLIASDLGHVAVLESSVPFRNW
jgi:hypothetical protein